MHQMFDTSHAFVVDFYRYAIFEESKRMDNHFSDAPTIPMPAVRPPRGRRRPWLIALVIIGVLLVVSIGAGILGNVMGLPLHPAGKTRQTQTSSAASATQTGQITNAATPSGNPTQSPSPSTRTTPEPASSSTANPVFPNITHGRPHLGGPFSDFVGKYGTPGNQGDGSSENFWTGSDQSIDINVTRNDQGTVTQLDILGSSSWNEQQTQNYCAQFLPDGAVQTSANGNQITYRSSAGKVVLNLQTPSCSFSFARG